MRIASLDADGNNGAARIAMPGAENSGPLPSCNMSVAGVD